MKVVSCILAITGLGLVIYAVVGRFIGAASISYAGYGPVMAPATVLLAANTALLLAILVSFNIKK